MELSAQQIAAYLHGEVVGDASVTVNTFAKIEEGKPHSLSFLANPKYTHYIYETQASIVLVNKTFIPEKPINATLIKVDDAYKSLADLLTLVENNKPKKTGIDPLAYIAPWSLKCFELGLPLLPPAKIDFALILGPNSTAQTKLLPLKP